MRVVTAADTPLTDYAPDDVVAAVKAKMTRVAPATVILIQPLVLGDNAGTFTLTISGWMDYDKKAGPGPGLRIFSDVVTAGNRAWTSDSPSDNPDHGWGADGAWRICDWDGTAAFDTDLVSALALIKADTDGVLILPTLGYVYLFPEISGLTNVTKVGLLWRPISFGDVVTKTHAFS
jgi:hypothetical protein